MTVGKPHWGMLFALIVLGGGTRGMLLGRETIEEGQCKLVPTKFDPSNPLFGLTYRLLSAQAGKPHAVRDLPAGFDWPCYYMMKTAGKQVLLVKNLSAKPSLCVDTRGDGVLSQQRCFAGTNTRKLWRFGPISLASEAGANETDGSFYMECSRGDAPGSLTVYPAFFHTGKLRLAGKIYQVAVADGDYDGRFRSFLSLPLDRGRRPALDAFAIDLNRNGKFENSASGRSEIVPLGHLVRVADAYYAIDIAPDGTSLTFSRTEPSLGTLVVEGDDLAVQLKLWSDAASQCLAPGRQWQLPAGQYAAVHATLEKKDAARNVWTFSGGLSAAPGDLGSLDSFVIKPGETTSIKIGPPLVVKAEVQRVAAGLVSIRPVITGCAGEQYQTDFQRNHKRAPQPKLKIVDEKGTVLVTDKFQYG